MFSSISYHVFLLYTSLQHVHLVRWIWWWPILACDRHVVPTASAEMWTVTRFALACPATLVSLRTVIRSARAIRTVLWTSPALISCAQIRALVFAVITRNVASSIIILYAAVTPDLSVIHSLTASNIVRSLFHLVEGTRVGKEKNWYKKTSFVDREICRRRKFEYRETSYKKKKD